MRRVRALLGIAAAITLLAVSANLALASTTKTTSSTDGPWNHVTQTLYLTYVYTPGVPFGCVAIKSVKVSWVRDSVDATSVNSFIKVMQYGATCGGGGPVTEMYLYPSSGDYANIPLTATTTSFSKALNWPSTSLADQNMPTVASAWTYSVIYRNRAYSDPEICTSVALTGSAAC